MASCTALGFAGKVFEGPCKSELSLDISVQLMEAAIDNAQAEASKGCPKGCICEGKGVPVGSPTCYEFTVKGQRYHRWVVTATFDGDCKCPKKGKRK